MPAAGWEPYWSRAWLWVWRQPTRRPDPQKSLLSPNTMCTSSATAASSRGDASTCAAASRAMLVNLTGLKTELAYTSSQMMWMRLASENFNTSSSVSSG